MYKSNSNCIVLRRLQVVEKIFETNHLIAKFEYDFVSTSTSKIYQHIRNCSKSNRIPTNSDSAIVTSDLDEANLFNNYFPSVLTKSQFVLVCLEVSIPISSLNGLDIHELDVDNKLIVLNTTKPMGTDSIGPKLLA